MSLEVELEPPMEAEFIGFLLMCTPSSLVVNQTIPGPFRVRIWQDPGSRRWSGKVAGSAGLIADGFKSCTGVQRACERRFAKQSRGWMPIRGGQDDVL